MRKQSAISIRLFNSVVNDAGVDTQLTFTSCIGKIGDRLELGISPLNSVTKLSNVADITASFKQ